MIEESFGRVLRELRRSRGLSQERLADITETHRTYISQLERGLRSPSLRTLAAIAAALSVSIRDLIGLVEEEEAEWVSSHSDTAADRGQRERQR
ncbi:MAG: helix-turn-helix transcriptional regulator [Phycisphaerales bacterium]